TREELLRKIAVLLAGRASEKLVFDHLSTGAVDDLARATDIARDMVTRYGMEESLGYVAFDRQPPRMVDGMLPGAPAELQASEATRQRIDEAVRTIVMDGYALARAVLVDNRAVLERTAQALLRHETLEEAALDELTVDLRRPAGVGDGTALPQRAPARD